MGKSPRRNSVWRKTVPYEINRNEKDDLIDEYVLKRETRQIYKDWSLLWSQFSSRLSNKQTTMSWPSCLTWT